MLGLALLACSTIATANDLPLNDTACEFLGTFQQEKFIAELDAPLNSSGQFYHHCRHGVIWSTTEPIIETLVMRKTGKGFLLNDTGMTKLKSRQGKFISKLLNSLMSNDQDTLRRQFAITELAKDRYQLIPVKPSLKRGIKRIELFFNEPSLSVSVTDRNAQKTQITSTQTSKFGDGAAPRDAMKNCQRNLERELCSLLFDAPTPSADDTLQLNQAN